jgi:hypothetical protein
MKATLLSRKHALVIRELMAALLSKQVSPEPTYRCYSLCCRSSAYVRIPACYQFTWT